MKHIVKHIHFVGIGGVGHRLQVVQRVGPAVPLQHPQLRVRAGRQPAPSPRTPEDEAEAEHDRRRLAAAVSALPVHDREVIALRWFAGLSEAEMATALGWNS